MPSAYHTFKLVPMAQTNDNQQPSTSIPPTTPQNDPRASQQAQPPSNPRTGDPTSQTTAITSNSTPSGDSGMNPPPLPRNLVTPTREMRESSVASSGGTTRKPRQNLDEHDHLLMVKHCCDQKEHYKEGTKAQFWAGVGAAFHRDTGKALAQMSATVGRLVESRRRQIADWESGTITQKPGGELNDLLDQWMEFLKTEDGEAEAERMRQVDARRKLEEARKEARRQTTSEIPNPPQNLVNSPVTKGQQEPPSDYQALSHNHQTPPVSRSYNGSYPQTPDPNYHSPSQPQCGDLVIVNGHQVPTDLNGFRSQKRKRPNEPPLPRDMQVDQQPQRWHPQPAPQIVQQHPSQQYYPSAPPELPRRVIVEGQLTKDDWKEIIGNDTRLRDLELKIEKIETLVVQNNKLLLQLLQNRTKEGERESSERGPVHLAAEFERDYL